MFCVAQVKQKYDRAVMKIHQLKQEQEELYGTVHIQSVEIAEWVATEQPPIKYAIFSCKLQVWALD